MCRCEAACFSFFSLFRPNPCAMNMYAYSCVEAFMQRIISYHSFIQCCEQIKLVQHTYSCLFGTFLFNTCREREKEAITNPSSSVWTLLHPENTKFHNPLFNDAAKEVSQAADCVFHSHLHSVWLGTLILCSFSHLIK